MTKFDILSKLYLIRDFNKRCCGQRNYFNLAEDNFKFEYHAHSTGQGINVYLVDGEKSLHIYYDYNWYNSRYEFNEKGKKHGHLIDNAPWIPVLEAKFAQFEKEILEVEEKIKTRELQEKQEKEKRDRELVEYFKAKF